VNFEAIDFCYCYPVSYMTARSRKPRTVYVSDVERLKFPSLTRQDVRTVVKIDVLRPFAKPKRQLFEQFAFEGKLLSAEPNSANSMKLAEPHKVEDVRRIASNQRESLSLFAEMLATGSAWADSNVAVVDKLPMEVDRVVEDGRSIAVQTIRDAAAKCAFIDGVFHAAKPAAVLLLSLQLNECGLQVWNGHHPGLLEWPAFNLERWDAANEAWGERGVYGKRGVTKVEVLEMDRSLAPSISEPSFNGRVAAIRGLDEMANRVWRLPSAGVAALARFSAALESGVFVPADILTDTQALLDEWALAPFETNADKHYDKTALAHIRLCGDALAMSQELGLVSAIDAGSLPMKI